HLWAETYDRKLTDIFGVESEIAKRIADSLQARLTGREEQALAVKPTNNPDAYDAYLRGLAYDARRYEAGALRKAIASYERAVQLDPNFAVAAWTYAMLRQFPAALKLCDRVLDIMPNDPDVMAKKASEYQVQGNLQEAAKLLSGINEQTPNEDTFRIKIIQLRLERNYGEA